MSYDSAEQSTFSGAPWEAYWFACGAINFRYTSGDQARTINGQIYEPASIKRSEDCQNQELSSGNISIELPIDNPVAQLFIGYLPPQPVSLVIFRGHEGDSEIVSAYTGMVSSPKFGETCELTIIREGDALKRPVPALRWQAPCPRKLYSKGCGVSKNDFIVVGTVSSVAGITVKSTAFAAKADGYFSPGWIEAHGTGMSILSHVGDTVQLVHALAGLAPGDVITVYPECLGTEADCANRFHNIDNCLACSRIPTENPFGEGGIA